MKQELGFSDRCRETFQMKLVLISLIDVNIISCKLVFLEFYHTIRLKLCSAELGRVNKHKP